MEVDDSREQFQSDIPAVCKEEEEEKDDDNINDINVLMIV